MARAPNYGFEKRRREMERKAKKDAKASRRRERPDDGTATADVPADEGGSTDTPQEQENA
jgi:hypothetical protein